MVALNGALFVNAAILIVAASVFFKRGMVVTEIQQAHLLLAPLLGTTMAGVLFAVALLCAGQSSTLTGTMAGQIVMEGFLNFRMRPWLRRLITRMVAVVPAALTILYTGEHGAYQLLILSQVILSMQLPFAVIPLIQFTGDRKRMGTFASPNVGEDTRVDHGAHHCWAEHQTRDLGRVGMGGIRGRLQRRRPVGLTSRSDWAAWTLGVGVFRAISSGYAPQGRQVR